MSQSFYKKVLKSQIEFFTMPNMKESRRCEETKFNTRRWWGGKREERKTYHESACHFYISAMKREHDTARHSRIEESENLFFGAQRRPRVVGAKRERCLEKMLFNGVLFLVASATRTQKIMENCFFPT